MDFRNGQPFPDDDGSHYHTMHSSG